MMKDYIYPFPAKEEAYRILERDFSYKKINPKEKTQMVEDAWQVGLKAAQEFLRQNEENTTLDFASLMRKKGIRIITEDRDYVSGNMRYFADCQPKIKKVTVYKQSVKLWADHNGYGYEQAQNLILMHEYFHFLEYDKLGFVSGLYTVPMLKWGNIRIGKTGIPALSEIAANAFASALFEKTVIVKE